jgi:bud site selection protein 20
MGRYARSRSHHAHKHGAETRKPYATKNHGRDYDQIVEDVADPARQAQLQLADDGLPGAGQHYCVQCARHFIAADVLERHKKSGPHKKMLRRLAKELPWTTEDARAMGVDNGKPLGRAPKPTPLPTDTATATATAATSTQPTIGLAF